MSDFRAPSGATRRRVVGEPRELEWPVGSGRRATYTPEEQVVMLRLVGALERFRVGSAGRNERLRELANLHELKVEFGVDITGSAE